MKDLQNQDILHEDSKELFIASGALSYSFYHDYSHYLLLYPKRDLNNSYCPYFLALNLRIDHILSIDRHPQLDQPCWQPKR